MTASLLHRLLRNEEHAIEATPDGVFRRAESTKSDEGSGVRRGILAGSFNPAHEGHIRLRDAADRFAGLSTNFEISVTNADKPPLSEAEILVRVQQFERPILLTNAPVFVRKAELFPDSTFVVGYDTAERILHPRYYGDIAGLNAALAAIRNLGCRFLVAARVTRGLLRRRPELEIPVGFETMFEPLPETEFREDISSTSIRLGSLEAPEDE